MKIYGYYEKMTQLPVLHSQIALLFGTDLHYDHYVDTNCCLKCTIPIHRPYISDIKVIVLFFSYSPHVEFTLYELTLD